MPHAAYPDSADLSAWLLANKLTESGYTGTFAGPIAAVVEQWQQLTGYTPFLNAASTSSQRKFNPPGPDQPSGRSYANLLGGGRLLDLQGGIIGTPSVTVDGVAQVRDDDYFLLPENSDAEGRPWTQIKFVRPVYAAVRGIAVTGPWGYCTSLPDLVWEALIQGAAAAMFFGLPNVPDLQSVSRNGLTESFEIASTATAGQRGEALVKYFHDMVALYRRGA